jgi:hypothetical protein
MPKALAEALGVSVDTVGRYAREGLIPFAVTPKGHRRYDLDEVRDALADLQGPHLSRLRSASGGVGRTGTRLVAGPTVKPADPAVLREEIRATRTVPAGQAPVDVDPAVTAAGGTGALEDVLGHARRVLVAVAR